MIHAILGWSIVTVGRYKIFEKVMQILVSLMFVFVIGCGIALVQSWPAVLAGLVVLKNTPGSALDQLGSHGRHRWQCNIAVLWLLVERKRLAGEIVSRCSTLGSVGGLRPHRCVWSGDGNHRAAGAEPRDASGSALVVALSEELGSKLGSFGKMMFLGGFRCAVFTSLLGVWQGVSYLFEDWWKYRKLGTASDTSPIKSKSYAYFLAYLAVFPLILQMMDRPLLVVMLYAVAGAFFMPLLAGTLLVINNRREWVGDLRNSIWTNLGLGGSLLLFVGLFVLELKNRFGGW